MSDEDEKEINSNSLSVDDQEISKRRHRLAEIRVELQRLTREKKKYDLDKLKQEIEFLQSEINELTAAISEINKEINIQTANKAKLHMQITNLRSRSQLHYGNLAGAIREKSRFEAELKKENKTEEYRELARKKLQSINEALPILEEENKFKDRMKQADEAQHSAMNKRNKLAEELNRLASKHLQTKKLFNESNEKLPVIETKIIELRTDLETIKSSLILTEKKRKNQRRSILSTHQWIEETNEEISSSGNFLSSIEDNSIEDEKQRVTERLDQINILIQYFQEKMREHGLWSNSSMINLNSIHETNLTMDDQKSILSSFMYEQESENAIAMKLPKIFLQSDSQSATSNEIIHSSHDEQKEIEFKKEFPQDILNKYGGQTKSKKSSSSHKNQRKHRKHFSISHRSQMINLYDSIRHSTESSDTLPSLPMFEYELIPTIKALESFKQSLEFYFNELSFRQLSLNRNENDDSALETFSESSSLFESIHSVERSTLIVPTTNTILDVVSLSSSDERKTVRSSSSDRISRPATPMLIDRQISDEGYRSVRNEKSQNSEQQENHSAVSFEPSLNYHSREKVDQWLMENNSISSSFIEKSTENQIDFQATQTEND